MKLTHDQAEGIGVELCDQLARLGAPAPLPFDRDNMVWADMVQLVLRRSAEVLADAAGDTSNTGTGGTN